MLVSIQEAYGTLNRLEQKRKSPCHIIKTLNLYKKKAAREKGQVTYEGISLRINQTSYQRL